VTGEESEFMQFVTKRRGSETARVGLRRRGGVFLLACAALAAAGCKTPGYYIVAPSGASYTDGGGPASEGTAAKELDTARRRLDAGEYSNVLPRLHHVVSQYPETRAAIDARYFLGVTYYRISGFPDALNYFNEYLELAPAGDYAAACREYARLVEEEIGKRYQTADEAAQRVAQAEARVAADPGVLAYKLELADGYWRGGRYSEAGAVYEEVLSKWPELAYDATIRSRVERGADGQLVILTPEEVMRREAESTPLVIFNTASFRSGREHLYARSYRDIFYNVSGQVVNRSQDPLHQVQITVTIYGFGGLVYETQTVSLGTLSPKQVRAFSVRFSNFDAIENVVRYECVGSYAR